MIETIETDTFALDRSLAKASRRDAKLAGQAGGRQRASGAAAALLLSHTWTVLTLPGEGASGAIRLDPSILFGGPMLGDSVEYLLFGAEGKTVAIRRTKLREISRAMRRFVDVDCWLVMGNDRRPFPVLYFAWRHKGAADRCWRRGGLTLLSDREFKATARTCRERAHTYSTFIFTDRPVAEVVNLELERARRKGFADPHPSALYPGKRQSVPNT